MQNPGTMFGGDEINAVVLDAGSLNVKAGYAGEDAPKAVFPSLVGRIAGSSGAASSGATDRRGMYVGSQAVNYRRDGMELTPLFADDGTYADWDQLDSLWEHALIDRLRIDPKEHPLLIAEPTVQGDADRERMVELAFEGHGTPAVFLSRAAVLASFATGRPTAVVVDMGHEATTAAAVFDGYLMKKSIRRERLGGAALTAALGAAWEKAGTRVDPPYGVKKVEKKPGEWSAVRTPFPKTHPTYKAWAVSGVLADAKEAICKVADTPFDPTTKPPGTPGGAPVPPVPYELPDGTEVSVGLERYAIPEALFRPAILSEVYGLGPPHGAPLGGPPLRSVPSLIRDCIGGADVDLKRELFSSVLLTGGSSLFPQVRDRIERDLLDGGVDGSEASCTASGIKPKVAAPMNSTERRFAVWIGGSILASLGSFQQMWLSRAEYDEHGKSLIHRRSP